MLQRAYVLALVVVVLCLTAAPAMAALSQVGARLTGIYTTNVDTLDITWSASAAEAGDDQGGSASDEDPDNFTAVTDTLAWAFLATAQGGGETGSNFIRAGAEATPPASVDSSGDSWAHQEWAFTALGNGQVSFDFSLDYGMNLQTDGPGETAYAWLSVWARVSSLENLNEQSDTRQAERAVHDGDDFSFLLPGQLFSVTSPLPFQAGESGYLEIYVQTHADAHSVVPLPGAVLLGFLGLTTAGLRLRRLT